MSNLTEMYDKYTNKWVAFNKDETKILASGKTIKDVEKKLDKIDEHASVITYILPMDRTFSPACLLNS